MKLLSDRRNDLVAARTRIVCRLHVFLVDLVPGGAPRALTVKKAAELLAKVRPRDEVGIVRRQLVMDHLAELRLVDRRLEESERRIAAAVASTGTTLLGLYGIGPVLAGRILGEVGHVGRFATKDHFASYSGTAPIDVSSGEQQRHGLSRAGNRQLSHALHMMAVTQIRNQDTAGRAYYEREGRRRQDHEGSTPVPQAPPRRRRLPPAGPRPGGRFKLHLLTERSQSGWDRRTLPVMFRLVRLAVLVVLFFLTIGLVVGVSQPETGPFEDVVLAVGVVALLALGIPARRIGARVE